MLATGQVQEAEALLRWRHPQFGGLPPSAFIGLAEKTGLIVPIGQWVLDAALSQLAEWQRALPGAQELRVAVNISGRQLRSPDLVGDVAAALRRSGVAPACLNLELTEAVLMADPEAALTSL